MYVFINSNSNSSVSFCMEFLVFSWKQKHLSIDSAAQRRLQTQNERNALVSAFVVVVCGVSRRHNRAALPPLHFCTCSWSTIGDLIWCCDSVVQFMIFTSPSMQMLLHFSACSCVLSIYVYVLQHWRLWNCWARCEIYQWIADKSLLVLFYHLFGQNYANSKACLLNLDDFILHWSTPAQHV